MIEPLTLASSMRAATAWATKKAAFRLRSMTASKSSSVDLNEGFGSVAAGVVDQDVEGLGLADHGLHAREVHHVQPQRFGHAAAGADCPGRCLELVHRARRQGHLRARLRQGRRAGQADAATRAGHERALAVEPEAGCPRQSGHDQPAVTGSARPA